MVVILYQNGYVNIAEQVEADLITAFSDRICVEVMQADGSSSWPADAAWDDLLIVLYDGKDFPETGNLFIAKYLEQRPHSAMLLPVSIDHASRRPPRAAASIKALEYDDDAKGAEGRLVNRVGAMLGLRIQGRDSKIFISYRAIDGTAISQQLYSHLESLGHRPFLDEAKEIDGETKILPGTPVQEQIDDALSAANLVLLIDTPAAPASPWIKHEIDTADALLLPILPIVFRDDGDHKLGPRFRSLLALQRWVPLQRPDGTADTPLSNRQLDQIISEAETYMCEIFKRKCRVPFIVEKEFLSRGFAWKVLDKRLLMYQSSKSQSARLQTKVLSHCSLFDSIYTPAMRRFGEFLTSTDRCNFSLFIYDGELLTEPQLQEIIEEQNEPDIIILHHQELAALIDSNFSMLGAS
ncbi:MAG TPA: toll/interleukin-1 receptor domain-containing protein [Pyrinomonadaceae bacterium]|nr:toll/interleukin-1 receptor domain-containing protein [Pyrinomonadaceae bacterium]